MATWHSLPRSFLELSPAPPTHHFSSFEFNFPGIRRIGLWFGAFGGRHGLALGDRARRLASLERQEAKCSTASYKRIL